MQIKTNHRNGIIVNQASTMMVKSIDSILNSIVIKLSF